MIAPVSTQKENTPRTSATALLPPGVLLPFTLVTGLFFLWAIPNNLNDILIRQFMKSFALTRLQGGLVQSAFYLGYFLFALPAGILMKHYGYKPGFLTGLLLFASGCFLFLPATNSGKYIFFLGALFVIASGLAFLETASNPFITQLGPTATSEARLNLAQAFNPIGAITGSLVGTVFIFSGIELSPVQVQSMQSAGTYAAYLHSEALRTRAPYMVLGSLALLWTVFIALTRFPAFIQNREHAAESTGNWRHLLSERHFLLAVIAQFFYVGAQVGTWSYFIQYAKDYGHTTDKTAGLLLTGTLGAFGIGRFASAALMRRFAPSRMMTLYALINIILVTVGIFIHNWTGLIAILLTSFFMSVMFPTIFALGLKDLGPNTNIAGSFLVMAIIGGAVLTPIMGAMHTTASAYTVPLVSYLVVIAFSHYMTTYRSKRLANSTFDV